MTDRPVIRSRSNPRLKALRRARQRRGDHLILEGPHLLSEALATGIEPELVLATEDFIDSAAGQRLAASLPYPPLAVDERLLTEVLDADAPRGIVALATRRRPAIDSLPADPKSATFLYLDGVQDPGNVGALARVAEAAGAAALLLGPGTADADHARALRASAGSLLRLPILGPLDVNAASAALAKLAVVPVWVALVAHGGEDLFQADLEGPLVLALGAEGPGLSKEVASRADRRLTIPTEPPVESLNVATAAAVVLFERRRRQRADGV